ncbi:MAG: hypothetical protein ACLQU1_03480 [Bryobacteraceae bacterium]
MLSTDVPILLKDMADKAVMPSKTGAVAVLLLACVISPAGAQLSGTTSLVLQVNPEARLDPQQVAVNFRVSAGGASDVTRQTTSVAAWVRALPGQQIRVTARLVSLNGPDGAASVMAVRWAGSTTRATAGGQAATCSSGTFEPGATHDLVLGWQRSGILTCAVNFELAAAQNLPPGLYSGIVDLALDTR